MNTSILEDKPYMDCVKTALLEFQPPLAMWHSNTMSVYLAESVMRKHHFSNAATFKAERYKRRWDEVHHGSKSCSSKL